MLIYSIIFALALIHTFCAEFIKPKVHHKLHPLFEVELAFSIWGAITLGVFFLKEGNNRFDAYFSSLSFAEPIFVGAIMLASSVAPIKQLTSTAVNYIARVLPLKDQIALFWSTLFITPLLGSLITEPASMTVASSILAPQLFKLTKSWQRYLTFGTLCLNVSVGGTLTHFAAPPVLMVAHTWSWTTPFVFSLLGIKSIAITFLSATLATILCAKDLAPFERKKFVSSTPRSLTLLHLAFIAALIGVLHHPTWVLGVVAGLIIAILSTRKYQDKLSLKEPLMIGGFLAGVVILGSLQTWWLTPIISQIDGLTLFVAATTITGFVDNALVTYLGAQAGISDSLKQYYIVAAAVTGGGLTLLANAPNLVGYTFLKKSMQEEFNHSKMFFGALPATIIAAAIFLGFKSAIF